MKQIVPFFIGSILLLSSCQKDQLTFLERRVVGEWTYSSVKYIDQWSVFGEDQTDDYKDITLTFYEDFSAKSVDANTGVCYEGLWDLTETSTEDTGVNNLFVSFKNKETGELKQLIFEDCSIGTKKIRSRYQGNDGIYRYVLE